VLIPGIKEVERGFGNHERADRIYSSGQKKVVRISTTEF
jgi:hypothetical protein